MLKIDRIKDLREGDVLELSSATEIADSIEDYLLLMHLSFYNKFDIKVSGLDTTTSIGAIIRSFESGLYEFARDEFGVAEVDLDSLIRK